MATGALVIAIFGASGAAPAGTGSADSRAQGLAARVIAPDLNSGAVSMSAPAALQAASECPTARQAVRFYGVRVDYWRSKMGAGAKDLGHAQTGKACPRYLAHVLQRKAYGLRRAYAKFAAERRAHYRRLYEKWRCIHEHEGAWNSNTGNGYWGGLQMDWGFMHTYGPEFIRRWGLAHRWPVWAQLEAAERAFHGFAGFGGRGYSPWGTRGMCGL